MDCSESGCGRQAVKRGFCEKHYMRRWRDGTLPPKPALSCVICGGEHMAKGLCAKHYARQYAGKDPRQDPVRSLPDEQRFWAKVDKSAGPENCWPWTAGRTGAGYGAVYWHGEHLLAHRVAYELAVGPIPPLHQLDHVWASGCHNRHCVNPAHLEPVSLEENVRRAQVGKRVNNGERAKRAARRRLTARFWAKTAISDDATACWPWHGYIDPAGTPRFNCDGASRSARSMAWELATGDVVPKGCVAESWCETQCCVNPDHLRVVPWSQRKGYRSAAYRESRQSAGHAGASVRWGKRSQGVQQPE